MNPDELLERSQWDMFWVSGDAQVVDRAELLYVSCPRDVLYLNTATRTRAPASRLPALVAEVSAAHAGVRSRWLVPETVASAPLEAALQGGGYLPAFQHFVYVVDVSAYRPRRAQGICSRRVDSLERLRDCVRVSDRAFGLSGMLSEAEFADQLACCADPTARIQRFVAYDEAKSEPLSSGGLTVFPSLRFGLLWAGGTVPSARGRGAYSEVLAARVALAHSLGLSRVGLYARAQTSAPIVDRQGFTRYGRMTYWDRPA